MCSRYIPSGSLCYIAASVTVYQSAIVCASADICSRQHPLPLRLWQIDILGNILNLIKDQPGWLKNDNEHIG